MEPTPELSRPHMDLRREAGGIAGGQVRAVELGCEGQAGCVKPCSLRHRSFGCCVSHGVKEDNICKILVQ